MIAEKRDRIGHRDIGGSPYMPSLLGLPCARAPRPSAATCGPGQPVPGSCPASPSAAAGLAVPPAITLQSLSTPQTPILQPTAQATEGEGQQYTTTTSHTPRWPAPSAPHGPAQPSLPPPSPPVPPNQAVAPLFFSECSGSTTSEAGPTGGPACPAMPPTPHPLGSIS